MKKLKSPIPAILVLCQILLFAGALSFGEEINVSLPFSKYDFEFSKVENYDLVRLRGDKSALTGRAGEPWLPSCTIHVLMPPGADVKSYNATVLKEVYLDEFYKICPAQPQYPTSDPGPHEFIQPDPFAYASKTLKPSNTAILQSTGSMRGYRIAVFRINPVAYIPASGKILLRKQIQLTITLDEEKGKSALTGIKQGNTFDKIVARDVINSQSLEEFYGSGNDRNESLVEGLMELRGEPEVKYLIIGYSSLINSTAMDPFKEWKMKKGVPCEAVTLESIIGFPPGNIWEKIRICIKDYVENKGTEWVLFVGDIFDRDTYVEANFQYGCGYTEEHMPTDLYYAELDSDWDSNENGIYGELDDDIELIPDVFFGRLPVQTVSELDVMVDKIISYEKNIQSSGFAEKMLLSGHTLWNYGDAEAKSEYMYEKWISPWWDGVHYRFYSSGTDFPGGSSYDLSVEHMNEQLVNGYNFLHMATHGGYDVWKMETLPWYYSSDALSTTNSATLTNILSMACLTNGFDVTASDPCLGEAFLRNPDGGAVSYIGCSREGFGAPWYYWDHGTSFLYDRMFYQFLFTGDSYGYPQNIGAVYTHMKENWIGYCDDYWEGFRWLQFGINLMGDPEMSLYTEDPSDFSPAYEGAIHIGSQNYTVETEKPESYVCLYKEDEVYSYGYSDDMGQYVSEIDPVTQGTLYVTITAPNYYPHEGEVTVNEDNDECTTAKRIYNDSQIAFYSDLNGASMSSESWPSCADPPSGSVDIWYRIYPGPSREITITLEGDISGGGFVVYSGSCGNLTLVDCAEMDPKTYIASLEFVSNFTDDPAYYIRLYGNPSMSGSLTASWVQDDPGNLCLNPMFVECDDLFYWDNRIPGQTTDLMPCMSSYSNPKTGQWLEMIVPKETAVTVSLWDYDLQMPVGLAFYDSCGNPSSPLDAICAWEEVELTFENPTPYPKVIKVLANFCLWSTQPEIEISCETVKYGQTCVSAQKVRCGSFFDCNDRIPGQGSDQIPCMDEYTSFTVVGQWLEMDVPPETQVTISVWDYDLEQYVGIGFFEDCGNPSSPLSSICDWEEVSLTYDNPTQDFIPVKILVNFCSMSTQPEILVQCDSVEYGQKCSVAFEAECGNIFDSENPVPGAGYDRVPCIDSHTTGTVAGRWLDLTVPPYAIVEITVEDDVQYYPVGVGLYNDCSGLSSPVKSKCSSSGTVLLVYTNVTMATEHFKVLINSYSRVIHPVITIFCEYDA